MQNGIVKVPKQFMADFDFVAAHYQLEALGELEAAKAAAKRDIANAITAFASLANEIRGNAA